MPGPAKGSNPWLARRVAAWAHRGGAAEGPANTLAAMRNAVEHGLDGIELDVRLTRDGHLVVCHDPVVESTTAGCGAIADMTVDDVRRLDAAWWFVPGQGTRPGLDPASYPYRGRAAADADYRMPTLEEVLAEFPGVFVNIDMKAPGTEAPLAECIRAYGAADRVIVASFSGRRLARFRRLAPDVITSAGAAQCWAFATAGRAALARASCAVMQMPHRFRGRDVLSSRLVRAAHGVGVAVHAWTVDAPGDMERMLDAGVDGIMTDRPSVLAEVLGRRAAPRPHRPEPRPQPPAG